MKQSIISSKRCLILAVAFVAVVASPLFASGSVWSEVKDNTAIIHHDDAWWNCCPDTLFEIIPHVDSSGIIDIYEHDLGTHPCDCMCYFDFAHALCGLTPGTYIARVWEVYAQGEPELAGTTSFTIQERVGSGYTTLMSECHEAVGEKSEGTGLEPFLEKNVTAQEPAEIKLHLSSPAKVKMSIYNVAGVRVRTLNLGFLPSGASNVTWDLTDDKGGKVSPGIYFIRLTVDDETSTLPLIVVH